MTILYRLGQGIAVLFFGFLVLLNGCMTFRTTDKKVFSYFQKRGVEVKIHRTQFAGKEIRFLETASGQAQENEALILFVHGAPGSSDNFHRYLADSLLLNNARLVSIDRLGYGYSAYGDSEISIEAQSLEIRHVLEQYQAKKIILVGHSYGGPIVGKYAMDFPDEVSALVLLAPVNDPEHEKVLWIANFGRWKLTKWMLPKALIVSADEKFSHAAELEKIASGWSSIEVPLIHIHGKKDKKLAPFANVEFSKNNIKPDFLKLIVIEDTGHFIPWTDFETVRRELLLLLEEGAID